MPSRLSWIVLLFLLLGCDQELRVAEPAFVAGACGSCHAVPDPGDLPLGIWDTVIFPRMGHFVGIYESPEQRQRLLGDDPIERQIVEMANIYPQERLYTPEEWAGLRRYFLERAPDRLELPSLPATEATGFRARYPNAFVSPPSASFIRFDPAGVILVGDINKEALMVFDKALEPRTAYRVGPGLTDLLTANGETYGTVVGSFSPTDAGTGSLIRLSNGQAITLASGLQRPTSLAAVQLDDDPEAELVLTEYGRWTGRLSAGNRQADGSWSFSAITERPGAIQVLTLPGSGGRDFLVLYGQGREEIVRYTTSAQGQGQARTVYRFPPSYGSSSLALVDWNGDAYPDLLHTAGDNADYTPILKPYHGVRVLLGGADGGFREELFLPLPGAYDARVADFDSDGDRDIAAISFFPDYGSDRPQSAVLFKNRGADGWDRHLLPASDKGRFLRLAAADFDGDGDTDLAAGSLMMATVPDGGRVEEWVRQGLPFVVWENGG